ncbi:MAG: truB [Frankiales bacterium]|nr:truB [Frankiales bacterium]
MLSTADASSIGSAEIVAGITALTGEIMQRPSSVSAIKVDGQRAYALVRAGEQVELDERPVTVSRFEVLGRPRVEGEFTDFDVSIDCSSGTYIRALARDLGAALGVGGHLTALRRTRVGPFTEAAALTLSQLSELDDPIALPLPAAIAASMPIRGLTAEEASEVSFGRTIAMAGIEGTYGGIDEHGAARALLAESAGRARPILGFTPFT